jgi:hypothetical protein
MVVTFIFAVIAVEVSVGSVDLVRAGGLRYLAQMPSGQ